MKMSLDHFKKLKESVTEYTQINPAAIPIMKENDFSDRRILWECYHRSKIDKHLFFGYDDTHIETALKRIITI